VTVPTVHRELSDYSEIRLRTFSVPAACAAMAGMAEASGKGRGRPRKAGPAGLSMLVSSTL
jgi:hypothetical protein